MKHRPSGGLPKRTLAVVAGLGMVGSMLTAATATATTLPADNAETSVSAADFKDGNYIVLLTDAPLATNSSTAPAAGEKLDVTTSAATSYAAQLAKAQDTVLAEIAAEPTYRYDTVLNGFSAKLTADEAAALANRGDVKSVTPVQMQQLHSDPTFPDGSASPMTDQSPDFLGLRGEGGLWEQLGGAETAGQNLVIGVIDTGLDYDNESFTEGSVAAPPEDWNGACDNGEDGSWPDDACTDKVIGADYFMDGWTSQGATPAPGEHVSPADQNSHGSHVASTVAGYPLTLSDGTDDFNISGMAPAAHISVYKVCWDMEFEGEAYSGCQNDDSAAAVEKAVEDGVDVLNYSIGGPDPGYNNDPVDEAFKSAAAVGIFNANSAGNSGPEGNPPDVPVGNNAPWVATVAAATHKEADSPTVAGFSSRGPVDVANNEQNLLKPDIGAPGVDVLAAVVDGWGEMSGTSMASPHIAGLALLLKQAHPDWSPMAIKSAMQTTAIDYTNDESNDPFVGGTGFVNPREFLAPGLVFDAGMDDWDAFEADVTTGYNYNTGSLQIGALGADAPTQATRTVTNVTDAEVSYTAAFDGPAGLEVTVSPETVTIPAGESAEVTISVRNVDAAADVWQNGTLTWTGEGQPDVNFTVIARGEQAPPAEEPPPEAPGVTRAAGLDRYETADAVSDLFGDDVDTVYIASGENYPDAVTGSPAAAQGKFDAAGIMETPEGNAAPVLLSKSAKLTNATEAALTELAPDNVVILGGETIINAEVEDQLAADYNVNRVAGENRYDTAANLALMFEDTDKVYVAAGNDNAFSDALTSSALAGSEDAPVLLTKPDAVPAVTAAAIAELDPSEIIVIGGEATIDAATYDELGATGRLGGANKFETAAAISAQYAADVPTVYVASANDYPDALASSSLAGAQDVPVIVVKGAADASDDKIPAVIKDALKTLSPENVVIVGGTEAVDNSVQEWLENPASW
uniref:cell wall-binding repeat-containing protein n=1 Tax=Ornithinimicrobium faecis TaxID=2934158 RepID=UPI002118A5E0